MFAVINATFAPAIVVSVAVLLAGKGRSALFRLLLLVVAVLVLKVATGVRRPDGSDCMSFPSGHSAVAVFLACAFRQPLVAVWAAGVMAARVHLRRHRVVDVVVGGALGALACII